MNRTTVAVALFSLVGCHRAQLAPQTPPTGDQAVVRSQRPSAPDAGPTLPSTRNAILTDGRLPAGHRAALGLPHGVPPDEIDEVKLRWTSEGLSAHYAWNPTVSDAKSHHRALRERLRMAGFEDTDTLDPIAELARLPLTETNPSVFGSGLDALMQAPGPVVLELLAFSGQGIRLEVVRPLGEPLSAVVSAVALPEAARPLADMLRTRTQRFDQTAFPGRFEQAWRAVGLTTSERESLAQWARAQELKHSQLRDEGAWSGTIDGTYCLLRLKARSAHLLFRASK